MPDSSDFRSPYRHGFLRVAAATLRTVIGDPAANAASVLATARECADEGVGLVVYPELTLTGYSIEDILLQDTLLDAAEAALGEIVDGVGGPAAGAGRRPAGAGPQPHPQRGGGRAPRAAAGRGAQVVPADLPRVLRAPPDRAGRRPARHDPPARASTCRSGPTCCSPPTTCRASSCTSRCARTCGCRCRRARRRRWPGRPCWRTCRAARSPSGARSRAACWRGRRRPGASRPTSTPRPARASRPPTSPGTARP